MEPTNLSAEIELNFQRDGDSWKAEMMFKAGPDGGSLPIEEMRVTDDSVLVRTKLEGAGVRFALARESDLLLGSVRVTEKGRLLAEGPAGLARASDTNGMTRLVAWLDAQGTLIDAARRNAVIERSLDLLLKNYLFLDRAQKAVADVRARAKRGEYESLTNPARLAEVLGRHLAEATGDRHVQVKIGTPRILDGNVGFIEIKRFYRADLAGDALADAMQQLAHTDALIIDVRECHGGDPVMVVLAASWLFDGRPQHWSDLIRRADSSVTQFWTRVEFWS